jgi:hypothetical protein
MPRSDTSANVIQNPTPVKNSYRERTVCREPVHLLVPADRLLNAGKIDDEGRCIGVAFPDGYADKQHSCSDSEFTSSLNLLASGRDH